MTTEARPTPSPPPMIDEPTPPPSTPGNKKLQKPRMVIGVGILAIVIVVYVLSLVGVHVLEKSGGPLPPLDLSQGGGDATIVQLRLEELKPVANRLTVNVLVYPGVSQYDNRFDVLGNDVAVRLYPTSDLGDLQYPRGKAPAQLSTTIEAHGRKDLSPGAFSTALLASSTARAGSRSRGTGQVARNQAILF